MAVIPPSLAKLPRLRVSEVGNDPRQFQAKNVEGGEEKEADGANRTKLDVAVANGTELIEASLLIVLCIISQDTENLMSGEARDENGIPSVSRGKRKGRILAGTRKSSETSFRMTSERKRSESSIMRAFSPRKAVAAPNRSIARSRRSTKLFRP